MKGRHIALIAFVAAAIGGTAWWALSDGQPSVDTGTQGVRGVGGFQNKRKWRARQERRTKNSRRTLQECQAEREKPVIELDDEELAELTELEKQVLKVLQDALDNNDFEYVKRSVAMMKSMASEKASATDHRHWSAHLHTSLKQAAVDALGWFGPQALEDLVDFMADDNADIAQSAIDQFELALQDFTLADYDRAEVIKMVSQIITDADTLDWMLMEALNARNSVAVDTLTFIAENGTPAAKEMLPDYIELLTGDEEIKTVSDLQNRWLPDNPDQPDDEEFYGRFDPK